LDIKVRCTNESVFGTGYPLAGNSRHLSITVSMRSSYCHYFMSHLKWSSGSCFYYYYYY